MADPSQHVFSGHYRRLQEIEQNVVRAIEAASYVMGELSKHSQDVDRELLNRAAEGFLTQIQEAQQHVLEAVKSAPPERTFESNNYFPMIQSMVAAEKLDAVSLHISGISKLLRQHRQQHEAGLAANGDAAGTAGDVLMMDDDAEDDCNAAAEQDQGQEVAS